MSAIFRLILLSALVWLLLPACRPKSDAPVSALDTVNDAVAPYDWTGTYELKDKAYTYTLKLHKRSVDGSYEMQFYNNSDKADLYKSSIYDVKYDSSALHVRFLNNFYKDATPLGFKSGDTLFILQHKGAGKDTVSYRRFRPELNDRIFRKISPDYQ